MQRKPPDRGPQDTEKLVRWIEDLDANLEAILGSRRWRLGHALSGALRAVTRRPTGPAVPVAVEKVREEFGAWRKRNEENQGSPEAAVTPPVHRPTVEQTPCLGSGEHVLEALRNAGPVTVIVPIYNAREDVELCLEALVRNTTAPADLLLIDDASTDPGVPDLLSRYAELENVRVLTNGENLGFVGTVNRGFSESAGDVVLLNSDVEVTPRWLENLMLAAHGDPRTATATPISDNAGAFSVPDLGEKNDTLEGLSKDEVGRLVTQESAQVYPNTPTANGFCMYIKRAALAEVGHFDAERFPRGYGEENDFCMRALKHGWNHVVDDSTFVFHRRSASFGEEKAAVAKAAREKLLDSHPDYPLLARTFLASEDMQRVREGVRGAFESARPGGAKPRVLFVIHQSRGGTTFTNEDLMNGVSDRYSPYLLVSNVAQLKLFCYDAGGPVLLEQWNLRGNIQVTEYSRPDYREIVLGMMVRYRFELVHARHLIGHTFDLPKVAARLRVPVVLSFHDFYYSCPTVHLIDDHGKHCGGICTPGFGQCTLPTRRLRQFPILKHAYLHTWREQVERMFECVDAFVTTSNATKEIYLRSMPALRDRPFGIIEHGRDLEQAHCAVPPAGGPIRILLPGNVNAHKGGNFVRELQRLDAEGRLEFHTLGRVAPDFEDLGINHGLYERHEFNARVREIRPAFMGIFSITPETYCHTLTEAWAAGVPVLASDIGTLRERVKAHGGGWLLDFEDPEGSYRRILEISGDWAEYERELGRADLHGIASVKEMADNFKDLYGTVLRERRSFERRNPVFGPR